MTSLLQQLLNALSFAGVFGLIALGVSLIFGMTGIINFAQGDLLMVGAYVGLFVANSTHTLWLAIVVATLAMGAFSGGLYLGLFDRVRNDPIAGFIVSIGLIIVLENVTQAIVGAEPRSYDSGLGAFHIGGVAFLETQLIVVIVTAIVLVALLLLYAKTPFGRVVRACVEDREAASLMGINVRRVNLQVLVIAGALAGLGGGLILPLFPITPFVGSTLTINAFLAAIIGGLRRVQGAVLGALVIGVATALNAQYGFTIWTSAEIYGLLIVILLIRPTGLLGNRAW